MFVNTVQLIIILNIFRLFEFRKRVCNRESCYKLVPKDFPVQIEKVSTLALPYSVSL